MNVQVNLFEVNHLCELNDMCWYTQCVGILSVLVYSVCWYTQCVGILSVLVYSVCWYTQCVGILSVLVYSVCWYTQCVGILSVSYLCCRMPSCRCMWPVSGAGPPWWSSCWTMELTSRERLAYVSCLPNPTLPQARNSFFSVLS